MSRGGRPGRFQIDNHVEVSATRAPKLERGSHVLVKLGVDEVEVRVQVAQGRPDLLEAQLGNGFVLAGFG